VGTDRAHGSGEEVAHHQGHRPVHTQQPAPLFFHHARYDARMKHSNMMVFKPRTQKTEINGGDMSGQIMMKSECSCIELEPKKQSQSGALFDAIPAILSTENGCRRPRIRWRFSLLLLAMFLLMETMLSSCTMARSFKRRVQGNRQSAASKPVNVSTSGLAYSPLIPGAPAGSNTLDIFACRQSSGSPCPTLVYVHGGSLMRGDKRSVGSMPDLMNRNGFCLVSLNYPVYGRPVNGLIEQQMSALSSATAWLEGNLSKTRPSCTMKDAAMMGHSAGAYLAALTATSPRYRATADSYRKFILNDSNWYTGKVARYNDSLATIFGQSAMSGSGKNSLLAEWVPAQLVRTSCPKKSSPTDVMIMYSTQRPEKQQAEIRSFASALNDCRAFNASLSAHPYDHKGMHKSIGEPGSSTGAAILAALKR
jgi:acetyl esterase/lipase